MDAKLILIEQFNLCYDENGWFVALKNALSGVAAENAIWKSAGIDNSIWEIVSHLNFYNEAYLKRFGGEDFEYSTNDNDETFSHSSAPSETDWQRELDRFDSVMSKWREYLASSDDSKLTALTPPR